MLAKLAWLMLRAMAKNAAERERQWLEESRARQEQEASLTAEQMRQRELDDRMLAMEERLRRTMIQSQPQLPPPRQLPPQIIVVQPHAIPAAGLPGDVIPRLPMAEVVDPNVIEAEVIEVKPAKPKALTWRKIQE